MCVCVRARVISSAMMCACVCMYVCANVCVCVSMYMYTNTVRNSEIGTGIFEPSKRVPIFVGLF